MVGGGQSAVHRGRWKTLGRGKNFTLHAHAQKSNESPTQPKAEYVRCIQTDGGRQCWSFMVRPCVVSGSQVCLKFATYRKVPWRLSVTRKANVRDRLKKVDAVIEAVRASGVQCSALVCSLLTITFSNLTCAKKTNALALPKEHEMDPKDKYTVFSPHHRGYRKGVHKVPKWTRVCLLSLARPK
jgi:hypothetical protein